MFDDRCWPAETKEKEDEVDNGQDVENFDVDGSDDERGDEGTRCEESMDERHPTS